MGLPEIVQPVNDKPVGNGFDPPAKAQLSEPVPPLAVRVCEYAWFCVPDGSAPELVTAGTALTTTPEYAVSTVLVPSVARIVQVNVPAALRVPVCVHVVPVVPVIQVPPRPVGCVPLNRLQVTVPLNPLAVKVPPTVPATITCVFVHGPSVVGVTTADPDPY